jgi:uncharacterized protein YciI
MFVVLLRFAAKRSEAGRLMDGHKQWIAQGFDDGVFTLVGSLHGGLGGAVVAHNTTRADLERRVNADPFVAEDVVSAEILEIAPSRIDERLQFMVA